ncbi:MAG: 4Fe-4S binding protein [Saprospiraceae bacterium]|nr:4Fe-4S binding protein [Saprospiraceae bacterium]
MPAFTKLQRIQNNQLAFIVCAFFALILMLWISFDNIIWSGSWIYILLLLSLSITGYAWNQYRNEHPGIKNNGTWFSGLTSRSWSAWLTAIALTCFYVLLYWWPEYLGLRPQGNTGLIAIFDPLSYLLKKQPASQWFVYGVFYTLFILFFGLKFIWKYRHNAYQRIRTISVMFFQLFFAFLIPEWMLRMNLPYNDLKNMWPLNYYFFDAWNIESFKNSGSIGWFFLVFGLLMIFVISPLLTYFFGKRWYCSWVCGCGALAETAGDPFRHLSDKSANSWKLERLLIYPILFLVIIMTIGVLYTYKTGQPELLGMSTSALRKYYGFFIGSAFSGVIGVGFYPLLGSRVWCRFGCPMAAILGIQQKLFSRFRITTNGGQCISCGNCSTYCEMGIDVRAYAQEGKNIVRASCVGCGVCAAVCPRGVLKLENGPEGGRLTESVISNS